MECLNESRTRNIITAIGEKAFYKYKKLKTIKIYAPKAAIGKNAFKSIKKGATFKVPAKSKSYYKKALKSKRVKKL